MIMRGIVKSLNEHFARVSVLEPVHCLGGFSVNKISADEATTKRPLGDLKDIL